VPDGERQRIGNQIDAAMIFARSDFVGVDFSTKKILKASGRALVKAMVNASVKALLKALGAAPILDRVHSG
jgi:hypothetical protein